MYLNHKQQYLLEEIKSKIYEFYMTRDESNFIPGETRVPLMAHSFSWEEVNQAIDSLLKDNITLNHPESKKVYEFEDTWSNYIGCKNGIMVNSGSSANLIALFALSNPTISNHIKVGDEIITPAVTWHTTVSPILCVGATPVFVDVKLDDFTIDVEKIEKSITPKTKAIMPVHLLGNPCQMEQINHIALKNNLFVIEDTCEAHGAEIKENKCGSFGNVGTFSFFFSHHITTMEGGMVVTNDDQIAELIRIMRSQGVIRNTKKHHKFKEEFLSNEKYKDLDISYLFANLGFNLRPTEINGGFGIEQFKKFNSILNKRRKNGNYWSEKLNKFDKYFHTPKKNNNASAWFSFPLVIKESAPFKRSQLIDFLNEKKIENRPIMSGNITSQPGMKLFNHRKASLQNSDLIHNNGLFWGNHQNINQEQLEYVTNAIEEFINKTC